MSTSPTEPHLAVAKVADDALRTLVEQVADYAIFLLDTEGHVATWNLGAQRIKGYSEREIVGQHFSKFYPPEDRGKTAIELEGAIRDGRYEDEGWRVRKDGSRFWANVVITALRDPQGKLVGFAKVTRDLTERRRAEDERAARRSAERVVGLLTRLQRLTGSLAAAHTPEEVGQILVHEGAEAVGATTALVVRATRGVLELVASRGAAEPLVTAFDRMRVEDQVPAATAYRTGVPQWIETPGEYAHQAGDFPASVPQAGSVAALPLVVRGEVTAVMAFRFEEPRVFPPDERALMETFALQAGQALDRAHVYAREVATRHRVEALGGFALSLSGALTVADVARVVVERGLRATHADTCTLYALDEPSRELRLVAERGCNPTVLERIRTITAASGNPVYATIATREALWAENDEDYAALFPSLARMPADGPRAHAFWSMPLVGEGRVIGLLGMGYSAPRAFPPEERDFIATFSRQCSEALLRATRLETERAARALAEQLQASLETTLRSIGDAVISTDATGRVTFMNTVAEALTGWSDAEARGRGLPEVFHIVNEKTRASVPDPVEKVLAEGVVVGLANHTILVARDGRETAIDDSAAPIRAHAAGAVEGVILVFRDVSEKKRAEARRVFLEEATAALVESLDYETTLRRVAELAVPRLADWCAIDQVPEGETLPRRVAVAHVDPAKIQLAKELDAKYPPSPDAPTVPNVLRTGRSELYVEIPDELLVAGSVDAEHLRIARALALRSAMVVPLLARGRVLGAMSFVFAESGRRYSEEDLHFAENLAHRCAFAIDNARLYASEQRARQSADVANRAKDEFLAIVSHELRTPLNAIMGWAKMMASASFDEARRERAVDTIERNAVAMAQLIEDLLDVSRIISGKMRLDVQEVDVGRVIDAAIDSVRPAADAKGVTVKAAREPAIPPLVADPTRLQQIVWNLLSNAVKFSSKGGRVDLTVRAADSSVEICVKDTGKGIAAEFLPHVFDPFRQEDASFARSRGGLGLGLAITRQLVELHGGRISATSPGEGQGATFTVKLPISVFPAFRTSEAPSGARHIRVDAAFERPAQLRGLRVVVVDDEADARQLVQIILEDCGCVVRTAAGYDEALAAIAEEVPDILLSDIGMPGRDGYDLIRAVRALPPGKGGEVVAAALTAYARAEDRRKLLNAGYSMHVPKPVEPAELVAILASLTRFAPGRA